MPMQRTRAVLTDLKRGIKPVQYLFIPLTVKLAVKPESDYFLSFSMDISSTSKISVEPG